jgi:endonuclease/exonuclease/phosphatase family metal-dependent hydrolase
MKPAAPRVPLPFPDTGIRRYLLLWFFLAAPALPSRAAEDPAAPAPAPVAVMSFNIRYGTAADGENHWNKRKEFLAETIAAFDPDLLGTQETLAFQRDFLREKLPAHEVFAAGRDDGNEAGEMAALFFRRDRFEKLAGGHFWLSQTPERVGSRGWDAALPRIATWVKLKDRTAPGTPTLLFLNTHFDHRGQAARIESARLLRAKIAELAADCLVIVTGDFNAGEESEPYRALFGPAGEPPSLLRDTFRQFRPARGPDEGTFCAFSPAAIGGSRIDWIACCGGWEVRTAAIDRTARSGRTPSDHFPVTAVLRLAQPAPSVRVLCYNIHHGEGTDGKVDLPRLARVIRAADPDLVALQEVDHKTRRTGGVDQTSELARLTGLFGRFAKAIDYDGGEYGQAILSRFPLDRSAIYTLPGDPPREQRIAFEVPLAIDGKPVSFVTTHLHHQDAATRERQAARLNGLFQTSQHPVILAGDLNATPESKAIAALAAYWTLATGEGLNTYPASQPAKQIDYVLLRPASAFRVLETRVLNEPIASDHRPVLVVLQVEPQPRAP